MFLSSQIFADQSILGGHPERDKIPGVEASTGALGHGLSIGVGMAPCATYAAAVIARLCGNGGW